MRRAKASGLGCSRGRKFSSTLIAGHGQRESTLLERRGASRLSSSGADRVRFNRYLTTSIVARIACSFPERAAFSGRGCADAAGPRHVLGLFLGEPTLKATACRFPTSWGREYPLLLTSARTATRNVSLAAKKREPTVGAFHGPFKCRLEVGL